MPLGVNVATFIYSWNNKCLYLIETIGKWESICWSVVLSLTKSLRKLNCKAIKPQDPGEWIDTYVCSALLVQYSTKLRRLIVTLTLLHPK